MSLFLLGLKVLKASNSTCTQVSHLHILFLSLLTHRRCFFKALNITAPITGYIMERDLLAFTFQNIPFQDFNSDHVVPDISFYS